MKGIFLKIHNWDSTPNAARDKSVFALCQKIRSIFNEDQFTPLALSQLPLARFS